MALAAAAGSAFAQDAYPSKPIRIIVPFTAGSATDVVARLIGEKLNAAPDGYTLAVVSTGHVVNDVLYKDLQYDILNDLAGVAPLASLPSVLIVPTTLGMKNVRELVAAARARLGELNYATAGVGSAAHIN